MVAGRAQIAAGRFISARGAGAETRLLLGLNEI
jgi:hypothetical protein